MPSVLSYVVSMLVYVAILVALTEISRRSIWFGLALNLSLIVLLFLGDNVEGWFRWAKDISVLFPMLVVHAARLSAKYKPRNKVLAGLTGTPVLIFFCAIVGLNILEASVKDITMGNYWNGGCGLVMIACMPFAVKKSWRFTNDDKHVLIADFSVAWCFLYTTWNACFVYAESPAYFAASCCILFVPELYNAVSAKKKQDNLWLHARIYTLMIHVSVRSFRDVFTPFMDATPWFDAGFKNAWGLVNFVLMAAYAVWWFSRKKPSALAA
ncbi:MAG: hypothetical protein KKA67_03330 [Spirochaetes bacterium]|nr:hypothetical protein [Spirochaetota bacterium]MBU1082250.1 hypothetical protein [Spirochaetota bacterium]